MKICSHYSSTPFQEFEGEAVHGVSGRVVIGKDDGATHFCMRIFTLAPGGYTPHHSHDWEHEILIHEGDGQVMKERQWVDVSRGSVVFVPGNEEHQFRNNGEKEFVFACLIPKGAPEL